ncbi:MAG: Uma2 family endonuclease [Planctomycetia bacterium]|nr:Uma2 family endonuclease [Planctomycetia bacterium]
MSTTVSAPVRLITAEEFAQQYSDHHAELDKGKVVETVMPWILHGVVCANMARHLGNFVEEHRLGRIATNDSWVITRRNPDSVRGPDVAWYSYQSLPAGKVADGLLEAVPELAIEIRSPSNSWQELLAKSSEYLQAGVKVVMILDPEKSAATLFRDAELPQTLHNGDSITIPDLLPGFSIPLSKVFGQ